MAAKDKKASVNVHKVTHKINRPGVHSKKTTSKLKSSKNYKKIYRGQGR